MPTNKLWLEHTERAAWDSVQALRAHIAELEGRLKRLGSEYGGVERTLTAIDAAKQEHQLSSENYAEIVEQLSQRCSAANARILELEQQRQPARLDSGEVARSARRLGAELALQAPDSEPSAPSTDGDVQRFMRLVLRTHEQRPLPRQRDQALVDALIERLERELEQLEDAAPGEIADGAVDVAVTALRAFCAARHGHLQED